MNAYWIEDLKISPNKQGARNYSKVSYPIRYGRFAEIVTPDYCFQFDLNAEIKTIRGLGRDWPHPAEWLKRSIGNDWIYYSAGQYSRTVDVMGEYYIPCLSYPSNAIMGGRPFEQRVVRTAIAAWRRLLERVKGMATDGLPAEVRIFLQRMLRNGPARLRRRAETLHALLGAAFTVLPPDSRQVDYNLLPLNVADGCLYHCGFCRVKIPKTFRPLSPQALLDQINGLKQFYGPDLPNYNAVFLGQHDALAAGVSLVTLAASRAVAGFDLLHSFLTDPCVFLFASADSLLAAPPGLFATLNRLPCRTYINVGLESPDGAALRRLQKPISALKVARAFARMLEINHQFAKIEISVNFVLSPDLSAGHLDAVAELIGNCSRRTLSKGTVYLSPLTKPGPLNRKQRWDFMGPFFELKRLSRLPVFLYLIQRL